jgi:lipopolysaccharide export system permease protein
MKFYAWFSTVDVKLMSKGKFLIPLYLLQESIPPIAISFAILSVLVFCQQISRNSEFIFSSIIDWKIPTQILLNLLPPVITFTLPVAIALGMILTISRLAADSEWFALETSTLGYLPRIAPFLFCGVVGFILLLLLNWNIGPRSLARIKAIRSSVDLGKLATQIQPQIFITQFPNHLLRIRSVDRNTGDWEGVFLLKKDEVSGKIQLLSAKSGSLTLIDQAATAFEIKLSNGIYIDNLLSAENHITSAFKENTLKVSTLTSKAAPALTPSQSNAANHAMFTEMGALFSQRETTQDASVKREVELELVKRLANAFACIYAASVTLVLSSHFRPRSSKRILFIMAEFLLLVIYYASLTVGQNLAIKGTLSGLQSIFLGGLIPSLILLTLFFALSHNRLKIMALPVGHLQALLHKILALFSKANKHGKLAHSAVRTASSLQFNLGHYLILSEFAKYLILAVSILTATILLFTSLDIAPSLAKNNISPSYAIGYLVNLSPRIIYYVAPFAILIGVVAAAMALGRTGQLTILLYNAVHPIRLLFPVLMVTIAVFFFTIYASDAILPFTNREQDYRYQKIKGRIADEISIAFDRQWTVNNENVIYGYRLFQDSGQPQLNALIFRLDNPNYYLSEAVCIGKIPVDRRNQMTLLSNSNNPGNFRYLIGLDGLATISPLDVNYTPVELSGSRTINARNDYEASKLTFRQLKDYINQVERTGLSTTGLRLELMQKLTFPFACVTLLFVSLPLCFLLVQRRHQSRSWAIACSIALALIFWAILSIFEAAGKREILPITLAAWSPHVLFLALAVTIQIRLHHS